MTDLTQLPASTISAFGGIIKDLLSTDLAKMAVFLIFVLLAYWLKQNTNVTQASTDANKKTQDELKKHAFNLLQSETNIKSSIKELTTTVERTKNELRFEIDRVKAIAINAQDTINQKLAMVPKVQDALKEIEAQTNANTKNINIIVEGLKALKRRGGPL